MTFQKERPHHPNHPPNKNHRGFFPKQQRNQGTIRRGDRQSALAFGLCEATAILRVLEVEVFFLLRKSQWSGMVDGSEIWLTHPPFGMFLKPCKEWDIHHINMGNYGIL